MKPLIHHTRRLAQRLLDAERVTSKEDAQRILHKVNKHQEKIEKWHSLIDPLERRITETDTTD